MRAAAGVTIRAAVWPKDRAEARRVLADYMNSLFCSPLEALRLDAARDMDEPAAIVERWPGSDRTLLLAESPERVVGCVGVVDRRDGSFEIKRLWTNPAARGAGLGRRLMISAIEMARAAGASTVLLDTFPEALPQAVRLYRQLGFQERGPYHDVVLPGLAFFELKL